MSDEKQVREIERTTLNANGLNVDFEVGTVVVFTRRGSQQGAPGPRSSSQPHPRRSLKVTLL